jgi:hypothetical protein
VRVLVLTSEPISGGELRDALNGDAGPQETEVMVVAPALHDSPLRFWLSDADDAIGRAEQVSRETVSRLGAEGVTARGDTGESDPLDAIADNLRVFDADRIVLFTHGEDQQRYREDVDEREVERRFGRPVTRATVRG